jgi:MerR family transcriptional regulator/heat shock protein HspR
MSDSPELRAVYVISVAAQLAGVHPQTLRNYERTGLLDPSRTSGGSRRFSDADLERLRRIQQLTNEGVNLEGVKRILQLESELAEAHARLEQLTGEVRQRVEDAHREHRRELVPVHNVLAVFAEARRRQREGR